MHECIKIITFSFFSSEPLPTQVYAGIVDLYEPRKRYSVGSLKVHPDFSPSDPNLSNDVGLVELWMSIALDSFYTKAIPLGTTFVGENTTAVTGGWGQLSEDDEVQVQNYQVIKVTTVSQAACQKAVGAQISEDQLCAYSSSVGVGLCVGDSGTPLVDETGHLIGVGSHGVHCATGVPDIFTRVSAVVD